MRYLVASDIHANLEALQAVLAAARGEYDRVLCCGDLVGYGADPNAVVEWARGNAAVVVRGNHDRACTGLEDLEWFNPVARAAALWTHEKLTPENLAWVRALPAGPAQVENFRVLHGSPLDEDEYVLDVTDAAQVFAYMPSALDFFGHTHMQGGFIHARGRIEPIGKPEPGQDRQLLEFDPDAAYLINPGSVGQPRDGDPRAAFILYDPADGFLFYHRVPYDVKKAQGKIRRAGLPPVLAERLALGR